MATPTQVWWPSWLENSGQVKNYCTTLPEKLGTRAQEGWVSQVWILYPQSGHFCCSSHALSVASILLANIVIMTQQRETETKRVNLNFLIPSGLALQTRSPSFQPHIVENNKEVETRSPRSHHWSGHWPRLLEGRLWWVGYSNFCRIFWTLLVHSC